MKWHRRKDARKSIRAVVAQGLARLLLAILLAGCTVEPMTEITTGILFYGQTRDVEGASMHFAQARRALMKERVDILSASMELIDGSEGGRPDEVNSLMTQLRLNTQVAMYSALRESQMLADHARYADARKVCNEALRLASDDEAVAARPSSAQRAERALELRMEGYSYTVLRDSLQAKAINMPAQE